MRHASTPSNAFPWRFQALCLLPVTAMLAAFALCIGTGDALTLYFHDARAGFPRLESVVDFFSDSVFLPFYGVYVLLLAKGIRNRDRRLIRLIVALLAVQLCVSLALVNLIKYAVGSPRPPEALAGAVFMPFSMNDAFQSFPSGHVTHITALALPLLFLRPRADAALFLGLIIALVAFSRLFLSRHHMADVAGGMAFGLLSAFVIHHLCRRDLP